MPTRKQLALIHVAKARLKLTEENYRDILLYVGGVASSRDLDSHGFAAVMEFFGRLGFVSDFARANMGHRKGMATPAQVALIRELWSEFTDGQGNDVTLGKWLEGRFGIAALRVADATVANKAIGALRNMKARKAG